MEDMEPKRYRLTVKYVGPGGKQLAPMRYKSALEGQLITVKSPEIIGFSTKTPLVALNLMHNKTVTVYYQELGGEP